MMMLLPFGAAPRDSSNFAVSTPPLSSKGSSSSQRTFRSWRTPSRRRRMLTDSTMMDEMNNDSSATSSTSAAAHAAAYHWLADECPLDILPHVLAFTGPQTTAALSKTNQHWRNAIMKTEGTWRVLCEETYKWKKGDPEPESWLDYYRFNPCVPTDYSTIDQALAVAQASSPSPSRRSARRANRESPPPDQPPQQTKNVRILLRPGKYVLRKPIYVQTDPGVTLTMETLQIPTSAVYSSQTAASTPAAMQEIMEQPLLPSGTTNTTSPHPKRPRSLRTLFNCSRVDATDESETEEDLEDWLLDTTTAVTPSPRSATLVLRSRKPDEPTIWVRQGSFHLRHVDIQHQSYGLDIWNGNAAVQIQPSLADTATTPTASATLSHCRITSASGRGIVSIDGGTCTIDHCLVRECAATGIYIGGPGSAATIVHTDVLRNGLGNRRHHRGIARGHSGIYLERGVATITASNVSHNILTGLSVISPEHAVLELRSTYLTQNGTLQMELPDVGTTARRRAVTTDNIMEGPMPTLRSGLE